MMSRPSTLSLAARLTLWYAAVAFLLLGASAFIQYRILSADLAKEDDQQLLETVAAAGRGAIPSDAIGPSSSLLGPQVRVLDHNCRILIGRLAVQNPPPICPGPGGGHAFLRSWVAPNGRVWRSVSQRIVDPGKGGGVTVNAFWVEATLDRWTDFAVLEGNRLKTVKGFIDKMPAAA